MYSIRLIIERCDPSKLRSDNATKWRKLKSGIYIRLNYNIMRHKMKMEWMKLECKVRRHKNAAFWYYRMIWFDAVAENVNEVRQRKVEKKKKTSTLGEVRAEWLPVLRHSLMFWNNAQKGLVPELEERCLEGYLWCA